MLRTILAGGVFLALSVPATCVFADPPEQQRASNEEESKDAGDRQPAKPRYEYDPHDRGPYYGALVPPPPETFNHEYPICTKEIQDGCVNPSQLKREKQAQQEEAETGEKGEAESGE